MGKGSIGPVKGKKKFDGSDDLPNVDLDAGRTNRFTDSEIKAIQRKEQNLARFNESVGEGIGTAAAVAYGTAAVATGATVAGAILSDDDDE